MLSVRMSPDDWDAYLNFEMADRILCPGKDFDYYFGIFDSDPDVDDEELDYLPPMDIDE